MSPSKYQVRRLVDIIVEICCSCYIQPILQVEPVSKVSQFQFYDYFSDQSPDHHKFAIPLLSIIHISNFNQVTSYNMNMYNSIVASFGLIITLGQGLGLPNPQTKNA